MSAMKIQRDKSVPLFIDDVRKEYSRLDETSSTEVILVLTVDAEESYRCLRIKIPKGDIAAQDIDIFERYILAHINNMLVTFGGARLQIYYDTTDRVIVDAVKKAVARYDVDNPKNNRKGLGCITNYISRMNGFLGTGRLMVEYLDIRTFTPPDGKEFRIFDAQDNEMGEKLLVRAASELGDKVFCGLDIGGNSIKAAAVADGDIMALKTYSWFPAMLTTAQDLLDPIILMVRFMSAATRYMMQNDVRALPHADAVLESTADYQTVLDYTEGLEKQIRGETNIFNGIVVAFPDTAINDKIAGGESYKQRGIRNNPDCDYEEEFRKQSDLNLMVQAFAKENGVVKVIIDGNLTSFVCSVEQAFAEENMIDENGMLAYTVGTEMGTGFISRVGTIQWIPLECYNYIIDLGSDDYYQYDANDVRSVKNFNTDAAGTVQKYISQIGMIRMALKHIRENDRPLYQQLYETYLNHDTMNDMLTIINDPEDMRSALTRRLIELLKDGNADMVRTFEEIGRCMGVTIKEAEFILPELSTNKLISGGIVMEDECFETIEQGMHTYYPQYHIRRLDNTIIHSPLLKKLDNKDGNYASAAGAAYLANRELLKKGEDHA